MVERRPRGDRVAVPSTENCLEAWRRKWKTLSERELEVELDAGLYDAEAPAGSPLTLSETGPLKPVMQLTMRSVRSGDASHNSTNGWKVRMHHGNCVRLRTLPSGSLNHAILAPPGAVQIPSASCAGKP